MNPLLPVLAGACGWAAYGPVGLKYTAYLLCTAVAAAALVRQRAAGGLWRRGSGWWPALAFWGWAALSVTWSAAAGPLVAAQLWLYALPLAVPVIALACPPALGRVALRQFALAAGAVGAATLIEHAGVLPAGWLWHSTVAAEGNQRIANSLVLALGAAMALLMLLQATRAAAARAAGPGSAGDGLGRFAGGHPAAWVRAGWALVSALALAGLALQDRRTGMVALPVLLSVLGWSQLRSPRRGLLLVAGVVLLSLASWQFSDGVRGRIDEGLRELRTYQSSDQADTSWGMRLRLAEHTLDMVRTRPLVGHGVGSWLSQWRQRVPPGLLISVHTTPHDEYLLVAAQFGLVGLALLLLLLADRLRRAWRAGANGQAALLVWSAVAWTGLFNVVLRDSKFALPMLLMAAFAGALLKPPAAPETTPPPGT